MFAMNPSFFLFIALHLCGKVLGMTVTTNTKALEKVEGDAVQMNCTYVTDAENMQALDIEWLKVDAPNPVVMYTDGEVITPLEGNTSRYNFSGDYLNGDASITIRSTQVSDSGTYICKVKKHGDSSGVEVKLTILGKVLGMRVTTNTQTLEKVEGDTVQMSCTYVTDAENMQALDIEWLRVDAPKPVVMYTDREVFTPLEGQTSRYNFSGDYLNGDASITIRSTQMSDGGTYTCMVKKHGDISGVEVKLTILESTKHEGIVAALGFFAVIFILGCCIICWKKRAP